MTEFLQMSHLMHIACRFLRFNQLLYRFVVCQKFNVVVPFEIPFTLQIAVIRESLLVGTSCILFINRDSITIVVHFLDEVSKFG